MGWIGTGSKKSTEKVTKVSQGEHSKRPRTEGISSRGSGPGEFSVKRSEEKYSVCGMRRKHSSVSVFGSDSCHSVLNVYFSKSMRRISSGSGKREVEPTYDIIHHWGICFDLECCIRDELPGENEIKLRRLKLLHILPIDWYT